MNKLTNCLINKDTSCNPIWFMRQAGRYLPEFRKIRSENPDFINLCLNSDLSSEITLQPINRFDLDAAIIFSDILMVPFGLGQNIKFEKDKGPILSSFNINNFKKNNVEEFSKKLDPVYEAIRKTRKNLDKKKSLICFVGSPWTLVVYMLGIKKEKNIIDTDILRKEKKTIISIINQIQKYLIIHIENQINAGADVVQIFDSWAGLIPQNDLLDYCYNPNLNLVNFCKQRKIPVICFPKGLKKNYYDFLKTVKPDGLNIDYDLDPMWCRKYLDGVCIQGGMNPKIMLLNDDEIFVEARKYLRAFKNFPYIFNLGHGLMPETNPDKIKKLINFVKEFK